MPKSTVYGPVPSWRLGRSIGIDLLCTETKTCNYDCVYCQLGKTEAPKTERQDFVTLSRLIEDMDAFRGVPADWVTFCGMGEPTLAANLGAAIALAKSTLGLPVAVFTNACLIKDESVRQDLFQADMVIAKLDAADDAPYKEINRPPEGSSIGLIIQGLQMFRFEYQGKLALDIMLTEFNKGMGYNLSYMTKLIGPAEIHLNTPVRAGGCRALSAAELEDVGKNWFWDAKCLRTVYKDKKPQLTAVDEAETELRHPTKPKGAPEASLPPMAARTGNG